MSRELVRGSGTSSHSMLRPCRTGRAGGQVGQESMPVCRSRTLGHPGQQLNHPACWTRLAGMPQTLGTAPSHQRASDGQMPIDLVNDLRVPIHHVRCKACVTPSPGEMTAPVL